MGSSRALNKISARGAKTLGDGTHNDGGGLYLRVKGAARSWIFRFAIDKRKREMGLGSAAAVSLADARELAAEARSLVAQGIDPVDARKTPLAAAPRLTGGITFRVVADAFLAKHEAGWSNPKHRQQWRNTLSTYAAGLMPMNVADIEAETIEAILDPIWHTKAETASRVMGRIERILDYAIAKKQRPGPNPATWKGNLEHLMAPRKKVVRHHPAIPIAQAAGGFQMLYGKRSRAVSYQALTFLILTAMRSGEVRGLRWDEIDSDSIIIPAARMKAGQAHRIPLTDMMRELLAAQPRIAGTDLVFPSSRGTPLNDMTLSKAMQSSDLGQFTVHGWRSTFSDWANESGFRREHIEDALAHQIGSAVERAYRRGDFMEQRRELTAAWGDFLMQEITNG